MFDKKIPCKVFRLIGNALPFMAIAFIWWFFLLVLGIVIMLTFDLVRYFFDVPLFVVSLYEEGVLWHRFLLVNVICLMAGVAYVVLVYVPVMIKVWRRQANNQGNNSNEGQ